MVYSVSMSKERAFNPGFLQRGRQERPSEHQFSVELNDIDTVYEYLQVRRDIISLSMDRRETQSILLGREMVNDTALKELQTVFAYDTEDDTYELATLFSPQPELGEKNEIAPRLQANSFVDMFELIQGIQPQLDLQEMKQNLELLLDKDYRISEVGRGYDQEAIILEKKDGQRNNKYFVFHPSRDMFCFHLQDRGSQLQPEQFQQDFREYASLLEQVVKAYYQTQGKQQNRDIFYKIGPQDNLSGWIERARKQIDMQTRALSSAGILDDTPELQRHIERLLVSERPDVTFEDIGGHESVKNELMTLAAALENSEVFESWGTRHPRGIVLSGPPGTGKTMLAKALANRINARFYNVELSEVIHHLWGRTERLIDQLFDQAQENGPTVIFIDELEALARTRGTATAIHDQTISVLLTKLQGLKERGEGVVVIGATNRIEVVDPALLRPGRLGDIIFKVGLPETDDRKDILLIHKRKAEERTDRKIFEDNIDWRQILDITEGNSGADLEEIIRRALYAKATQEYEAKKDGRKIMLPPVGTQDILDSISQYEKTKEEKQKASQQIGF